MRHGARLCAALAALWLTSTFPVAAKVERPTFEGLTADFILNDLYGAARAEAFQCPDASCEGVTAYDVAQGSEPAESESAESGPAESEPAPDAAAPVQPAPAAPARQTTSDTGGTAGPHAIEIDLRPAGAADTTVAGAETRRAGPAGVDADAAAAGQLVVAAARQAGTLRPVGEMAEPPILEIDLRPAGEEIAEPVVREASLGSAGESLLVTAIDVDLRPADETVAPVVLEASLAPAGDFAIDPTSLTAVTAPAGDVVEQALLTLAVAPATGTVEPEIEVVPHEAVGETSHESPTGLLSLRGRNAGLDEAFGIGGLGPGQLLGLRRLASADPEATVQPLFAHEPVMRTALRDTGVAPAPTVRVAPTMDEEERNAIHRNRTDRPVVVASAPVTGGAPPGEAPASPGAGTPARSVAAPSAPRNAPGAPRQ